MALTEDELQNQWKNAIDIIEKTRVFVDSLGGSGQEFDKLINRGITGGGLEGEYTPEGLMAWASGYRSQLSSLLDSGFIYEAIAPCILEYGQYIASVNGTGSNYGSVPALMSTIYDHFINSSPKEEVASRNISFDIGRSVTGTGNGQISRLTKDENDYTMEACHVEHKVFRCIQDENSGAKEFAEVFEFHGEARGKDNLNLSSFGSGELESTTIVNRNAGSGTGGSLLKNSSFSAFDSTLGDSRWGDWTLVSGTVPAAQDATYYYNTYPGASTDAALKATADFRIKQPLSEMRRTRLNPDSPYFLRVMVNGSQHSAAGGTFHLYLGGSSPKSTSIAISGLSAGWNEVIIALDKQCWFKEFNAGDCDVGFEWGGRSGGSLLVDDMIFCEMDFIDGHYWVCRMNHATPVSWKVDDEIDFTDTGGAPSTGKINYYLWRAGLGYLPHDSAAGDATFGDP